MGDMADLCNSGDTFEEEEYSLGDPRPSVSCRYCGQNGLYWLHTDKGWRLADNDMKVHTCKKYRKEI